MPVENIEPHRRRLVNQNIVPCDLNELHFSSTDAEDPTTRRRRRQQKPLRASQIVLPDIDRSQSPLFPVEEHGDPESHMFQSEQSERFDIALLPPQENDVEVNTSAWERSDEIMADTRVAQSPEPDGAVVLDPEYSERQYYREPLTGFQREIWRPGDGDGSQSTDYYQRAGPVLPMHQRWRLFQSNIGPVGLGKNKTEPPRFVFLDDRAAHEVLTSDIQRARLNREWPHDFAANGRIRARRTHCGRPAIKDPLTFEFHTAVLTKTSNYSFTGEKDYKPIIYRVPIPEVTEPTVEELIRKRKAEDAADPLLYNPRGHGHNQYTPKDMMVKFGAPTFSRKKSKGDDDKTLAKLKSMAPNAHVRDKLIPRVVFGDGTSPAGSVRSQSKTVASEASTGHSKTTTSPEMNGAVSATEAENRAPRSPEHHRDEDDKSDSDTDIFPKHVRQTQLGTPTPTAAAGLNVPRQLGYIERRVREQALAQETMNAVQNQDDVIRIANELATAKVTLADQAKEIERLRVALEGTQSELQGLQDAVKEQERLEEMMRDSEGSAM